MKKHLLVFLLLALVGMPLCAETEQTEATVPAFPGAEGYARYTTTGGRGGTVYHVTNLNDSGTGSLRDAVNGSNRTIVFDVSGNIDLQSDLKISKSNITIAGQTAPGDGITVRYYTVTVAAENVIIRFVRFRRSQVKDVNDGADAIWGRNKKNIILDHCSFSWSIDEIASFYDNANFTMQWCILGEALANPGHSKGEHSYGGIWGGKKASFHHNFLCHMQNRVPRFNGARYNYTANLPSGYANCIQAEQVDFRNCVMYNWGTGGCYGGPGGGQINMINNYYKAGPGTSSSTNKRVTQVTVGAEGNSSGHPEFWGYASRYYIHGNYMTAAGTSSAANYDWKGVVYDDGLSTINGERYIPDADHKYGNGVEYVKNSAGVDCVRLRMDEPIDGGEVSTHSAEVSYEKVLNYVGASLKRDAVDERYMEEARTGTCVYTGTVTGRKGIIDKIQVPGASVDTRLVAFPDLVSETRPAGFDTDKDGMPDEWEIANGLNPNSSSDGKLYTLDSEKKWYTNLECYLNSLVEPIVKAQNEDAETSIDEYYPVLAGSSDGLAQQVVGSSVASIEYYDLAGHRLAEPANGISIRRILYVDGSASVDKVIKR